MIPLKDNEAILDDSMYEICSKTVIAKKQIDKPFITIEFGDYNDLMNNIMEDLDPFPFDLTESELFDEVKRFIIEE